MNFKDIGKGLKKLGKGKVAKELTGEVTEETLASITNGLLERNKELLNGVGNQWKKEAIDTAGALSHLPEVKSVQGALHNKGESVFSKSPLRVTQRTGKYGSGYDVVGTSANFSIEGVIKSKNSLSNYLRAKVSDDPTNSYSLIKNNESFNSIARDAIDGGKGAPYWVRTRAAKNPRPTPQPTTRKYNSKRWSNGKPKYYTKKLKDGTVIKGYLDKDGVEVAKVGTTKNGVRKVSRKRSIRQDAELRKRGIDYVEPNNTYLTSRYDPKTKKGAVSSKLYSEDKTIKNIDHNASPADNKHIKELPEPTKNRRRGNKAAKKAPVNSSAQQDPQLLLEAPAPRKTREYKSDLGTNTEPIPLSGPVREEKKTLNFKKGEGIYTNPSKKRISESAEYNTKLIKKYHPTDPTYNLGIKTEGGWIGKEKDYRLPKSNVQPEPPVEPAPQSKPKQKNNKVDVSIDDFKSADELDLTDSNDIDVSHLFEESDTIKESQLDKLEELRENGTLSQEEYEKAIDNVINDSNMNIETDSPIMSEPEPEVKNQPKERQSRRQQRKEENLKNNRQQTNTQEQQLNNRKQIDVTDTIKNESNNVEQEAQKNQQQIFNEYAEQNFKPLEVGDDDLSAFKAGDGYDVTLRNARAENITLNDTNYDVFYNENGARVFRNTETGDFVQDQDLANSLNSIGENERNKYLTNLSDDNWDLIAGNSEKEIAANPEKFGFNRAASEGVEGYDARLMNEMDANNFRKAAAEARSKDVQKAFGEEKDKKIKKQLEDKRNKLDIEALKAEKVAKTKKIQLESRDLKKEAGKKFNEALGLDKFEKGSAEYYEALKAAKGTAAYEEAVKDLRKQMGNISKSKEFAIKNSNKVLDSRIKGLMGKGMNLTKAITIGNAAIAAVDKYKESKAEGKSTGSALIRAGGAAVAGEILGIPGTLFLTAAQTAPKAIIAGADALYKEHRRMNSSSNFVPLGGVNFQDSQELATMRQSGMELAKMSQYNLEQSLMGAEAKHLHR